ncbi:ATP-dependent DNA helicase [Granulosicoccus sp.]|nr:ATP-dependent DNA helicase [Granulosicoccus sp.]MDB4224319.1 ATP-dependent DNA helicase [Granulosicoccus sp.]
MSRKLEYRVSVTDLANFACREGDLMPMGVAGPTARQGIRAHKKIQKTALESVNGPLDKIDKKDDNNPPVDQLQTQLDVEVSLDCITIIEKTSVVLRGRIDIVDFRVPRLSEIKTTLVPVEQVPESQHSIQWAQLYLYGYIFLNSESTIGTTLDTLELELLHVNIRADTISSERRTVSREEAFSFATRALECYVLWLNRIDDSFNLLQTSAQALEFPYADFRTGQRDMAAGVFRAIRDGEGLLCEAATGIGKTISTLFPATKVMGGGDIKQITYLTAKVAGRLIALQSLKQMQSSGLRISAIQIRAKQATCFCSNGGCERDETGQCPMTLGFFDRLPDARDELISMGIIEGKKLDEVAWQYQLCPFELALQMLPWVHVVIADYNYVFDPLVRLPHYSESRMDSALLIDEAHNLVDRSREMFSAHLSRERCLEEAHSCRLTHPLITRSLERLSNAMLLHVRSQEGVELISDESDANVAKAASETIEEIVSSMGQAPPLPESSSDIFRILCRYVAINELFSTHHKSISEVSQRGRRKEVIITLYCLDASKALAKQLKLYKSKIVFSATLRPSVFYRDTLGLPKTSVQLQATSPFDSARAQHTVVDWIDTRYRKRKDSLNKLVELIKCVGEMQHGSYLVFFPSYAYLEQTYIAFTNAYPNIETWRQHTDQSKDEQNEMLLRLNEPGHRIGFAILGGVFGEGIDYLGGSLIGVVIVSTGLPGLNVKTQLVAEHYRQQGNDGYDFAYRYPGFSRVLQTAGRLIRSESDSGVVVLVDDRFKQPFYRDLYPESWQVGFPENLTVLLSQIESFWSRLPDRIGQSLER